MNKLPSKRLANKTSGDVSRLSTGPDHDPERDRRVAQLKTELLSGRWSVRRVVELAVEWGVAERTVRTYAETARVVIRLLEAQDLEAHREDMRRGLEHIEALAHEGWKLAGGRRTPAPDLRAALEARRLLIQILGLAAPTRIALSRDDLDGLTDEQLRAKEVEVATRVLQASGALTEGEILAEEDDS